MFPYEVRPFLISVFATLFFINLVDYIMSRIDDRPGGAWTMFAMFGYPLAITANVLMMMDHQP